MIFIHQTLHKNICNAIDEGVIASVNGLSCLVCYSSHQWMVATLQFCRLPEGDLLSGPGRARL